MRFLKKYNLYVESEIIGNKKSIFDTIKNLKLKKEYKEIALTLLKGYTKAKNRVITGLQLHPLLLLKIKEGKYPNGFDMGIDKNGYFIHTHRARSKSYEKPDDISVKEIEFINSTA